MEWVRAFRDIGWRDVPQVGGKNASLGEMLRELGPLGVRVPDGFAITAEAYRRTLEAADAGPRLRHALDGLDATDVDDLARRAREAREIVRAAPLPSALVDAMRAAYAALRAQYGGPLTVAVRSSATAEDLPSASFAGQHDSFLNVDGDAALLDAVRACFASLFNDRAIRYRIDNGFDHFKVFQSVGVMKMVRADEAASGVAFTLDTESGFRDVVFLTASWGLGENVVQGTVDPDEFYVFKPTLREGHRNVLRRKLGGKKVKLVYTSEEGRSRTVNVPVPEEDRRRYCLADAQVVELAEQALAIEDHYSRRAGHPTPMDIEWALDGVDGQLYIVQARPETVSSQRPAAQLEAFRLLAPPAQPPLVSGRAVGSRIAAGKARVLRSAADLHEFRPGEILVADATMPDWGTVMKGAAAVITDRGGRTCHAAIVARELGIPAVVGCGDATARLHTGDALTVACAAGAEGHVYAGSLAFGMERIDLRSMARPQTRMMVNLGNPDLAFHAARLPNDGVGLARIEFIVAEHIRAHPMALAHPERIADVQERDRVLERARGHARPADYFVRELAEGVATIAAAFYPKPVIVRLSDFKTNEYARLPGGRDFEPAEENPALGFRGASRYTHPAYADGFALECAALRQVRETMGLGNVRLMVPFCRRVPEAERVLEALARHGLGRGVAGLRIDMMCEIPNNVMQIDAFAALFDGFSIGSNDLTQLVLGVDRDSALVAFDFDEHDEGVLAMIRQAIAGAQRHGLPIGLCGQAVSDDPELAGVLVEAGIDSLGVTPDTLLEVTRAVLAAEQRLGRAPRAAAKNAA